MNYIENFYNSIEEDNRLFQDKRHYVEYLTTIKYIFKYLKKGFKVLEVGAATGVYSRYIAKMGYEVHAIELLDSHIKVFKSKIDSDMNITVNQGNALDLSMYKDNTFDIVLNLGPMYHLFNNLDKKQAVKESIRVLKPNGIIMFAYITDDALMINYGIMKDNLLEKGITFSNEYRFNDLEQEVFSTFYVKEFDDLLGCFNVRHLKNVAIDGLSPVLRDYINVMDEEKFNIYMDYHYKNCERKDLIGYSSHVLYIGKKYDKFITK